MFPVELQPGQYMATPVNAPIAFVYDKDHKVIGEVRPRYSNDLSGFGNTTFTVECSFEALDETKRPIAFMNVLHSEIIVDPRRKKH